MSVEAITWALKQPIDQSSTKFVLVIMANCANGDGDWLAWPSAPYIADCTSQDLKTVKANLARLRDMGYIEDSGERRGRTRQVVVYRIHRTPLVENRPKNGTVPETAVEPTRFSQETGPKTDHGTIREPSLNQISPAAQACIWMREEGIASVNPSHPGLLEAMAAGVTATELRDVAREFAGKNKGMAYIVATAHRRKTEGGANEGSGGSPGANGSDPLARRRGESLTAWSERVNRYHDEREAGETAPRG